MTLEELQIAVAGQIADCMPEGSQHYFTFVPGNIVNHGSTTDGDPMISYQCEIVFKFIARKYTHKITFGWIKSQGVGVLMSGEIASITWSGLVTIMYFDVTVGDLII